MSTPEDLAAKAAENPAPAVVDLPDVDDEEAATDVAPPVEGNVPDWAELPEGMKLPEGWLVWFVRFKAATTNTPNRGDRTCVLWNLSESDEKNAARRARGDGMRVIDEMAKQMIRAIDGKRADWSGKAGPASVEAFWNEIGGKCRHQLKSLYLKNHTMSPEENADFFDACVAPRSVG